jgi:hypothetical protein
MSPLWWSMVWVPSAIVVGTFCDEHFKRLPRSLQTGLVPKLMSSSRLHKMHIGLHNLMWFLKQCNAWMIWYTIRNALLDTKLLLLWPDLKQQHPHLFIAVASVTMCLLLGAAFFSIFTFHLDFF